MSFQERRELLRKNSSAQTMWYILIALQVLGLLSLLYNLVQYFMKSGDDVAAAGLFGGFIIVWLILVVLLNVWIAWGIYQIERWVTIPIWIVLIGNLLSFNLIGLVIAIIILIVYRKVLAAAYPKAANASVNK